MTKHLLKVSSYPENEAIIYCPQKGAFGFVGTSLPLVCPHCGKLFMDNKEIKLVLKEDFL